MQMWLIWNAYFNQRKWKRKRKSSIICQLCYCSIRVLSFYWKNIMIHIRLKVKQGFNILCNQNAGQNFFINHCLPHYRFSCDCFTLFFHSFWNRGQEFDDYLTLVPPFQRHRFLSHQFSSNIAAWHQHFRHLQKISNASPSNPSVT